MKQNVYYTEIGGNRYVQRIAVRYLRDGNVRFTYVSYNSMIGDFMSHIKDYGDFVTGCVDVRKDLEFHGWFLVTEVV